MAAKADEFEVELDNLGQNTVIGEDLLKYFRKDHCIYLTKTMFKYLNLVSIDLCNTEGITVYKLASLNALIRLIKINLRCLAICKINLDTIVTTEQYQSFDEMRAKFNSTFVSNLKKAVSEAAIEKKKEVADLVKAKEEEEKAKEAASAAEENKEESKTALASDETKEAET